MGKCCVPNVPRGTFGTCANGGVEKARRMFPGEHLARGWAADCSFFVPGGLSPVWMERGRLCGPCRWVTARGVPGLPVCLSQGGRCRGHGGWVDQAPAGCERLWRDFVRVLIRAFRAKRPLPPSSGTVGSWAYSRADERRLKCAHVPQGTFVSTSRFHGWRACLPIQLGRSAQTLCVLS